MRKNSPDGDMMRVKSITKRLKNILNLIAIVVILPVLAVIIALGCEVADHESNDIHE
jgi:hypothetical protein